MFGRAWQAYALAAVPGLLSLLIYVAAYMYSLVFLGGWDNPNPSIEEVLVALPIQLGGLAVYLVGYYWNLGGLTSMALRQIRGEEVAASQVFDLRGQGWTVFGAYILAGLAVMVGFCLCFFPGLLVFGLLSIVVPLILDQRMGAIEAISTSWSTLKPFMLMVTLLMFLNSMIAGFSVYLCGVGALFGLPFYAIVTALIYRDVYLGPVASPAAGYGPPPTTFQAQGDAVPPPSEAS